MTDTQTAFLTRILPTLPAPDSFGNAPVYYALGLGYERPQQTPHSSIQSLIARCTALSNAGHNAYMALGSFKDPLAGRKQANAVAFKSVWADIDAGKEGSKYANATEALADLTRFIETTALYPTYIVSSGMGLHVYWAFTSNVDGNIWKQIATLFHQLCKQEGLDIDPSRATDGASVLRLPGTMHTKSGRMVQVIMDSGIMYAPADFVSNMGGKLHDVAPVVPVAPVNVPQIVTGESLGALVGMGPEPPKADAERIARNCPQILAMGHSAYPAWFTAMTVLRRCVNGLEWAHKLSALCPEKYDSAITERRFYEAHEDMPAKCATFERLEPKWCEACQYKGQLKSPVQLDRMAVAPVPAPQATTVAPIATAEAQKCGLVVPPINGHLQFPDGWKSDYIPINSRAYEVTHDGIVHVTTKVKGNELETTRNTICDSRLYFKHSEVMVKNHRPHRSFLFDAYHPSGEMETVRYIVDEDSGPQNTMNWFNNAKMFPLNPSATGNVFMGFMNAYLNSVVHRAKEIRTFDNFGWIDDFIEPDTKQRTTGFITGDGVITTNGVYEAGYYSDSTLKAAKYLFTNAGTIEDWKHVPRMYQTLDLKIGQLAMCFSFAAPLMKYSVMEARNCILNIWSGKGGLGKSSVLLAASTVWGNPGESFFAKDSTFAAIEHKLAVWNNMPAMLDELTEMTDEKMTNLAFAICSGKQREKMNRGGASMVETGDWETCTFCTANKSFKECIARRHADTDAATKRVMDYEWDGNVPESRPDVLNYIRACLDIGSRNYGKAGPEFLFQLMQQPERLDGLRRYATDWATAHGFKGDERFMAYPLAVAMQAGRWAVEMNLLEYDMDALEKWVFDVFVPHNRKHTEALAPDFKDMMVSYLSDRAASNTLVVRRDFREKDEIDPKDLTIPDKYIVRMPTRELTMRYERDNRMLFIMRSDFTAWCKERKVSALLIINELELQGIHVNYGTARLARNVSVIPDARARVMIMEADALDRLGFNTDEV